MDKDLHFNSYVSVDIHLDKNVEDIIPDRVKEYEELLINSRLRETSEDKRLVTLQAKNPETSNALETTPDEGLGGRMGDLENILLPEEELRKQFKEKDLIEAIRSGYHNSQMYEEILGNPKNFP